MRKYAAVIQGAVCVLAGVVGLGLFANAVQHRANRANGRVDRTTAVKSTVSFLLVPAELIAFSKKYPVIEQHEQLVRLFKSEGMESAWFAIVADDHLSSGEINRSVRSVYPGPMEHMFPTTKAILSRLSETSEPAGESHVYKKARIVTLSPTIAKSQPRLVLDDLVEALR